MRRDRRGGEARSGCTSQREGRDNVVTVCCQCLLFSARRAATLSTSVTVIPYSCHNITTCDDGGATGSMHPSDKITVKI